MLVEPIPKITDTHRPLNHDEVMRLEGLISEYKSYGITNFDWEVMADDLYLPYLSVEREGEKIQQENVSRLKGDGMSAGKDQNPSASLHTIGPLMSVPGKENHPLE
jgi:hypothetical protein